MNRTWVPNVPVKVFFNIQFHKFQVLSGLSFYCYTSQELGVRPGIFLLPGADYSPQIIFKTAAAILAVPQRLLSFNTCRGFLILRSDNSYRLLHLPGNCFFIKSMLSHSLGNLIFAGVMNWILILTLAGEFSIFPVTEGVRTLYKKKWILLFQIQKWKIVTFSYWKVKNCYFFVFNLYSFQ